MKHKGYQPNKGNLDKFNPPRGGSGVPEKREEMEKSSIVYYKKEASRAWKIIEKLINKLEIIELETEHEIIDILEDGVPFPILYSGILCIKIRVRAKK